MNFSNCESCTLYIIKNTVKFNSEQILLILECIFRFQQSPKKKKKKKKIVVVYLDKHCSCQVLDNVSLIPTRANNLHVSSMMYVHVGIKYSLKMKINS